MEHVTPAHTPDKGVDSLAEKLRYWSQNILVVIFGLLPIFFIPSVSAPLGYSKILFVVIGVFIALILFSFSILRSGKVRGRMSLPLLLLWAIAAIALTSASLSGDFRDALIGNVFEVHTSLFMVLMAVVASVWSFLGIDKAVVMRLYVLLAFSTVVLALHHLVRLLFGPDVLGFGVIQNAPTGSLLGGWNDVAIFFGLIIVLSLTALQQLPLTKWFRMFFGVTVLASLIMLMVINFFAVWLVVGVVSLILVIYILSKGGLKGGLNTSETSEHYTAFGAAFVALAVSIVFMIAGSSLGNVISQMTGTSYIEVRPSFTATASIVKNVYTENIILGVGPNKFIDAWRLHKDPAINATVFWNTDFTAGVGYIPTMFATMGVVGGVAWIAFLLSFVYFGIKLLTRKNVTDRVWYFIATASFVVALYVWGMSMVYVPGPTLLLLAALCTGLVAASANAYSGSLAHEYRVESGGKTGFVLISVLTVFIIVSVSAMYFVGNHFASAFTFNKSLQSIQVGSNIDVAVNGAVAAFTLSEDDRYLRRIAEYQIARINSLLRVQDVTDDIQKQFGEAVLNGQLAAQQSVERDSSDALNWAVQGTVHGSLVPGKIEGRYELALEAYTKARELDPHNPQRVLALAQLELANGNVNGARELTEVAIRMKPDYGEAVFLLSQIDISRGDVEGAIAATRSMVSIEPNNPIRYYQLGVLQSAAGNDDEARLSFERAVALDNNYSNARYFLALLYDRQGRPQDAREQLEVVLDLNPDNSEVIRLLTLLDENGTLSAPEEPASEDILPETEQPVEDPSVVTADEGVVTTDSAPDTPLISPVNTVADDQGDVEDSGNEDSSEDNNNAE